MRPAAFPRRPEFLHPVAPSPGAPAPAPFARRPIGIPTPATFPRTDGPAEPLPPPEPASTVPPRPAVPAAGPPPEAETAPAAPEPPRERLPPEYLERLAASIDTLRLHADRLTELCAEDAIVVGTAIARRILEAELTSRPDGLYPLVRSALRKVGEARLLRIRLAPEDARAVTEAGARFGDEFAAARVEVHPDPSLRPGDVQVDADFGTVDGRLDTRLAEIGHVLAQASAGAAAGGLG